MSTFSDKLRSFAFDLDPKAQDEPLVRPRCAYDSCGSTFLCERRRLQTAHPDPEEGAAIISFGGLRCVTQCTRPAPEQVPLVFQLPSGELGLLLALEQKEANLGMKSSNVHACVCMHNYKSNNKYIHIDVDIFR